MVRSFVCMWAVASSWLGLLAGERVHLRSLLAEMVDPTVVARVPAPAYRCLQMSSYNRESVRRDAPGWFADSDGTGFIRTEETGGRTEWVLMEHEGPGCLTKMWTPAFYMSLRDRTGPALRIYLDGAPSPVIDENFIALVTGRGSLPPPLAAPTARAGDSYFPIPFGKSCKVTLTGRPFYFIINYRAYAPGTEVETYGGEARTKNARAVNDAGRALIEAAPWPCPRTIEAELELAPGAAREVGLPPGPAAVGWFALRLMPATGGTTHLRATVLELAFDGEDTAWCPVGDFFCSPDAIHPFQTYSRTVAADGTMTCRWLMPYRTSGRIGFANHGNAKVRVELRAGIAPWTWDERSLHFHAGWRPDELLPGTPFADWTFVDVRGQGVFVGDAWTVLNPTQGWWGEGDEKIYIDAAWDAGFPTHFGTGTEDYYGWAGGEVPTRKDEFTAPFLANVRVGGLDGGRARGYNICTRARGLDAIPFDAHLRFDMEISPGTDQRRPTDFLGYSAVVFWYARPGATDDRRPNPEAASRPIMTLADIAAAAVEKNVVRRGGIELEGLAPSAMSPDLQCGPQRPAEVFHPRQWSGERHFFVAATKPGEFVEWTLTEQFERRAITLWVTTSFDFGIVRIAVNGRTIVDDLDCFSQDPAVREVSLGTRDPVESRFTIRCELVAPSPRSRGARTYMGFDRVVLQKAP